MLIVGDLNIAASQRDVFREWDRETMYDAEEKALFAGLLAGYADVWRRLHPLEGDTFTVWDERTNKRPFNEVGLSSAAEH